MSISDRNNVYSGLTEILSHMSIGDGPGLDFRDYVAAQGVDAQVVRNHADFVRERSGSSRNDEYGDDSDDDLYSSDDDTTIDDYTNDYAPTSAPNNFIDSINRLLGGGRGNEASTTDRSQLYEPLLITDEDYEDYNDVMSNLDGIMTREISPNGIIHGSFDALFEKYADNPVVKAILRDSYNGKPVQYAIKDDFYDDTDDLLVDFKGMSYHKFNHMCSCQKCVYVISSCICQILTKKYLPYRLPYLDAAFEEIFTYGSWQNDGILWNTTYDELMYVMMLYYPGYGCSAVEINPGQLYVCIHAIPYYVKMDVTPKILSRILSSDITSYNESESTERNIGGFYVHGNGIDIDPNSNLDDIMLRAWNDNNDDTLPPLVPDIN
jgi:hypothetical protein